METMATKAKTKPYSAKLWPLLKARFGFLKVFTLDMPSLEFLKNNLDFMK